MTPLGMPVGSLVRLARASAEPVGARGPVVVVGPLAQQLARSLAEGGDASLVRVDGDPEEAGVLVCVLGGAPTEEQRALLRVARRAGRPVVAVQAGAPATVPYVLPEDVVDCPPGHGFPVERIAAAIARAAGSDAAPLAAGLPAVRGPVVRTLVVRAAASAAAITVVPWVRGAHLPLLVPLQARALRDVEVATGATPRDLGAAGSVPVRPEVGLALAAGLAGRALARALPGGAPVRAAIAGGATLALGLLAARPGVLTQASPAD